MTKKQYRIHSMIEGYVVGFDDLEGITCELQKDGKPITYKECCDTLNRLTDENEKLKKEIDNYRPIIFESEDGYVTLYEKMSDNDE